MAKVSKTKKKAAKKKATKRVPSKEQVLLTLTVYKKDNVITPVGDFNPSKDETITGADLEVASLMAHKALAETVLKGRGISFD